MKQIYNTNIAPQLWFCIIWILPTFIFLSLADGKQLHYLLPLLPPLAIFFGHAITGQNYNIDYKANKLIGIVFILAGIMFITCRIVAANSQNINWISGISVWWSIVAMIIGIFLTTIISADQNVNNKRLAISSFIFIFSLYISVLLAPRPFTSIEKFSHMLASLQDKAVPLANIGTHREQFEFIGKLNKPLDKINIKELKTWVDSHPDGYVVARLKESDLDSEKTNPVYSQPYRFKQILVLISSKDIIKNNYTL